MELLRRLYTLYNDLNPATLSGAIDVIVVRQPDGSLKASPFHVRFGKVGSPGEREGGWERGEEKELTFVHPTGPPLPLPQPPPQVNLLRSKKQRFVRIRINGEAVDLKMCVGSAGECYFMEDEDESEALESEPGLALPLEAVSLASSVPESLASSPPNISPKVTDDEDNVPPSPVSPSGSVADKISVPSGPEIEQWEWGNLPVSEATSDSGIANSGSEDADTYERSRRVLGSSSDSIDSISQPHAQGRTTTALTSDHPAAAATAAGATTSLGRAARPPPLTIPQDALASSFVPQSLTTAPASAPNGGGGSQSAPETTVTTPTNGSPKRGWMKNISSLFTGSKNRAAGDAEDEDGFPEGAVYLNQVRPVPEESATNGNEDYSSSEDETRILRTVGSGNNLAGMQVNEDDLDNISFHSTHEDLTMEAGSSSSSRSASPATVSGRIEHVAPYSVSSAVNIPRHGSDAGATLAVPNAAVTAAQLSTSLPPTLDHISAPITLSSSLASTDSVMELMHNASLLSQPTASGTVPPTSSSSSSLEAISQVSLSLCGGLTNASGPSGPSTTGSLPTSSASGSGHVSSSTASSGVGSPATTPVPPPTSPLPPVVAPQGAITRESFEKHLVTFDQFQKNPALLSHPDLVVRINNGFYSWGQAAPMIMSLIVFQRPLVSAAPQASVQTAEEPKKAWKSWGSWWSWGKRGDDGSKKDATGLNTPTNGTPPTPTVLGASDSFAHGSSKHSAAAAARRTSEMALSSSMTSGKSSSASMPGGARGGGGSAVPRPASANASIPIQASDARVEALRTQTEVDALRPTSPFKRSKKGLRLSSDQLKSLNLKDGANVCEFSIITKLQGKATVKCLIYLWDSSDRVVISDIDGTITRSDVLGHAAALVGTDWTQMGVASLFSSVEKNGYRFLYLSSRSISHAGPTRAYVKGVKQQDYQLPDGPIMLSPASLFQSLHREVILRKPEVFKIACLQDILSLFPEGVDQQNPFTAGFGNRNTDVISYRAVGIPSNRIFIIDPTGLVKVPASAYRSSYQKLNDIVNEMFPPVPKSLPINKQFGTFEFWHIPPPVVRDLGRETERQRGENGVGGFYSNPFFSSLQLSEEELALLDA